MPVALQKNLNRRPRKANTMRGRRFFVFEIGTVAFCTQDRLIHVSTRPTFPQQKLRSPLSLRGAKDDTN